MIDNWTILNIGPTDDKEAIRRAYMMQLPKYNPEDDPEGFANLRRAYEDILKSLDANDKPEDKSDPVALFLVQLKEVYNNFERRCNVEEWKLLLSNEACIRLDLEDNTSEQILNFLTNHYYLPKEIWQLLIKYFGWETNASSLRHKYPINFIDFVISSAKYESLNYKLFLVDPNAQLEGSQYDRFIWLFFELEAYLHAPNSDDFIKLRQEIETQPIRHVYYDLQIARMHVLLGESETAIAISQAIYDKLPNDSRVKYAQGLALLSNGKAEEAKVFFESLISENENDFASQKALIETMMELEEYEIARVKLLNILDRYPYNPFALHIFRLVTEKLAIIYEEKYKQNPDDMDIILTLAKHYLNGYYYDKCQAILEKHNFEHPRYYEYLADCYYNSDNFDEALKLYEKNLDLEKTYRNYVKYIGSLVDAKQYSLALSNVEDAILFEDTDNLSLAYIYNHKGLALHHLRRYEEAIEAFDKGLELSSQAAHIYVNKAKSYQSMHRYAEAISSCELAISIFPYHTEAYTIQMEIFYDADLYDRMISLAEQAEKNSFNSPKVRYHMACALRMQNENDKAQKILEELIEDEYDEGYRDFFHVEIAYLSLAKEQYGIALYHITKALELSDDYPYRYVFLGNVHRLLKDYKTALQVYSDILLKFPNYTYALIGRGDVYYELGDYTLARKDYKASIAINDNMERAYDHIIDSYVSENRFSDAIFWAERVLIKFDKPSNYLRLAHCLSLDLRYEQALEVLDKGENLYPDKANDIILRRGLINNKLGNPQEALDNLLKGINALDDKDNYWNIPYIYTIIGLIYADNLNEIKAALEYFKKAPNSSKAICYIGDIQFYFYKDYKTALELYEQSIDLDSADPYNYIARAKAHKKLKNYLRANRDFNKALSLLQSKEESTTNHIQMAFCYIGLGKFKLASKIVLEILDSGVIDGECYYCLGLFFEEQKKHDEALKLYDKAIAIKNSYKYHSAKNNLK